MAQPQGAHEADDGATSGADGSLHEERRKSELRDAITLDPPPPECEARARELPSTSDPDQQESCEQAEGSGASEDPGGDSNHPKEEHALPDQESNMGASAHVSQASPLDSNHDANSEEASIVQAEAANDSSVHEGRDLSANDSHTKAIPSEDHPEAHLPRKLSLSSLPSKQQGEQNKVVSENECSRDATGSRQSARILQLKAKFERHNQPAAASSEGPHTAGSASPAETTRGGIRHRFGSARHSSPTPVLADDASQGSPSVQLIRSRFEHMKDRRSPSYGELKAPAKTVASRKLDEQALQKLALVDIAARYGKPYKRKEKATDPDRADASHAVDHDSDGMAGSSDKRTVGGDSPAGPMASFQGEEDVVVAEPESKVSGISGGVERGADGGGHARRLDTLGRASAHADQETDEAPDHSSASDNDRGDAEAETTSATICGHPSPAIERLAAIIAGKAQNYGKPVPRRLLTRQESDLP
ncbi:hypothetical protein ACSSS7_000451 [Eimeria intestinalis]